MRTYIILLRGVMPTGKNKVPMAKLREILTKAGFKNVRTYIASGNVLLESNLGVREVETRIHKLIKQHIGPDIAVIARTRAQLQKVLRDNPFTKGHDLSRVFFVSFATPPKPMAVKTLLTQHFGEEKLTISKHTAYLFIPGTYGRGTLSSNFLEKKLDVIATMRNFNTISKLIDLGKEAGK